MRVYSGKTYWSGSRHADRKLPLFLGTTESITLRGIDTGQFLMPHEIERAASFKFDKDRQTYIAAHAMLNKRLSESLKLSVAELSINLSPGAKPVLAGGKSLDFNLSHSSNAFVFAVSDARDLILGVDIEEIREITDIKGVADSYFHPLEQEYILSGSSGQEEQRIRFYEIWTRKESFLKMLGLGITNGLQSFTTTPGLHPSTLLSFQDASKHGEIREAYIDTFFMRNLVISISLSSPRNVVLTDL